VTRRYERTAIHEAAHAVVALAEARPFHEVVIERTEVSHGGLWGFTSRWGDDELVRVGIAGFMAHRMCITRWDPRLFEHARDDLGKVADFFRERPNPRLLRWNVEATHRCLLRQWNAVKALAYVLLKFRRVTYANAKNLAEAANRFPEKRSPEGRVDGWDPLVKHIEFRIRWPGGIEEAIATALASTTPKSPSGSSSGSDSPKL